MTRSSSPHRDRHGRGMRGVLAPPTVPLSRTRGQRFDDHIVAARDELQSRLADDLASVEIAVEDVPDVDVAADDPEVLDDHGVPLSRVLPAGRTDAREDAPARIVLYRRPLELRAADEDDLEDVVREVLIEQVATLLGRDPDEIDPPD
ncbi:MAG: metallopeptidase family protein [Mycobacteriales bacterium]